MTIEPAAAPPPPLTKPSVVVQGQIAPSAQDFKTTADLPALEGWIDRLDVEIDRTRRQVDGYDSMKRAAVAGLPSAAVALGFSLWAAEEVAKNQVGGRASEGPMTMLILMGIMLVMVYGVAWAVHELPRWVPFLSWTTWQDHADRLKNLEDFRLLYVKQRRVISATDPARRQIED